MDVKYLIIGGGPAGLGAACALSERGMNDYLLVEKDPHFGGLAASFVDQHGFTWDIGGHVLFSHYKVFDGFMDKALGNDGWMQHQRESWIWIRNRFIPYPFQFNLHRLSPGDLDDCLAGLQQAIAEGRKGSAELHTFDDWIHHTFGAGISNIFMIPYNYKVWGYPASQMDCSWINERVAIPDMKQVLHSITTGQDHISWGPNATFKFPCQGGTGAIWTALGRQLPREQMIRGDSVCRIDAANRSAYTRAGKRVQYFKLISTIPLDQLMTMLNMPVSLNYSSVYIIGIGMDGAPPPPLQSKCWMYFPEQNSPYYRVTVFSNYSANNVSIPHKQWSLMAEVSETAFKRVDSHSLVDLTVREMTRDGLIPSHTNIVTSVLHRAEYAYPTPFLHRDRLVDPALRVLEEMGIYSRGRFGAWKYEIGNMDHSFMQGYECVQRLEQGGGVECESVLYNACPSFDLKQTAR